MKKILILMMIASAIFVSCNAPTEVKAFSDTRAEPEVEPLPTYTFKDFFNPVEIVHADKYETSTAIIMDKNTGVLYLRKASGYQWGMSPIYNSDGTIMTFEKWNVKQSEKKD